jgi:hypothetical protein
MLILLPVVLMTVIVPTVVAWRAAPGADGQRRGIAVGAVATEATCSIGLLLVTAQLATGGEVLCPTDAACSAPYSLLALVTAPVLFALTVATAFAGLGRRWRPRDMAILSAVLVIAFVTVVVLGSTYRIDVPRP